MAVLVAYRLNPIFLKKFFTKISIGSRFGDIIMTIFFQQKAHQHSQSFFSFFTAFGFRNFQEMKATGCGAEPFVEFRAWRPRRSQAAVRRPLWIQMPLRGNKFKWTTSPQGKAVARCLWFVARKSRLLY
ncbi:hypothetical protein, partial [Megasphaera sp.]|uniref:hypothetical protein n=1 Tax=Megasphaera sp. TaxID=2023260 RepID=UPI0025BF692E